MIRSPPAPRTGILEAVHQLSLSELDERWIEVERTVDATPEIDRWCSGPDWQIPVCSAFAPETERLILATEDNDGFALLARYPNPPQPLAIGGLEPLWGFGSPILGADPAATAGRLAAVLHHQTDWRTLFLPGIPVSTDEDGRPARDGVLLSVAVALSRLGPVRAAEGITRQVADLDDYDRWLARRTPRFRRNLRQARARAGNEGLCVEDASADPKLFQRLMAIEHRSWKGQEGSGITSQQMSTMYRLMIDRLRQRQRLLAHVARLDGDDVGYILGGVRGRRYRGLQLSFDDRVRHLSVGNVLQDHQLRQLDAHNLADVYDLGMDFGYKQRWADRTESSLTLVVNRG